VVLDIDPQLTCRAKKRGTRPDDYRGSANIQSITASTQASSGGSSPIRGSVFNMAAAAAPSSARSSNEAVEKLPV
jgi:hypothetical protein